MPHAKYLRAKVLILTFLAIGFPFFVNELLGKSKLLDSRALLFMNPDFWYRKLGPSGTHQPRIDEFKIVIIDRNIEPGSALGENRCTHREFMANLIKKVATADPRLIVVDKWYGKIPAGVCIPPSKGKGGQEEKGNDGTPDLRAAIREVSTKIPVVLAVGSYNGEDLQQFCPNSRSEDLESDQVVLGEYEPLNDGAPGVSLGLVRIEKDPRKVPLSWKVSRNCLDVAAHKSEIWPTLATAAAAQLDPSIMADNNLTKLQNEITFPYTKLFPEGKFKLVSAIGLLCNKGDTDWKNCGGDDGDKAALEGLRHKVVIIGERWVDLHKTDVDVVNGPHLQANYIAALLDESILKPVPKGEIWTISLLWLLGMFLIFYWWKPLPELAVLASASSTFVLGVFFSAVMTRQFGVFANVVPPTILEIIGLYLARRTEMLMEQHKEPSRAGR
jgi:hypothetical protein